MKIGIIGHGFVGGAVDYGFTNVKKFLVDTKYNTTIEDLFKFRPDAVFVCVPTPMGEDRRIDASIVDGVVDEFIRVFSKSSKVPLIIKSTVTPDHLEKFAEKYDRLVFNPEFLTERNAKQDFIDANFHILGGNDFEVLKLVKEIYLEHSNCKTEKFFFTSIRLASLAKYTINSFLATKVIFFNHMHSLIGNQSEYDVLADIMRHEPRIGSSHLNVPGFEDKFGYGGTCFPKDTNALYKYSENAGFPHELLKTTIECNEKIRND
jgi:UDPglucose 6-dehydrogenase